MTVRFFATLTDEGAALHANAVALGTKLNLTQLAVGDGNGVLPTPDPAQKALINLRRIAAINLIDVDPKNPNQIIIEQIIPENEGGFWIREIGLYNADNVLVAVANCPETYKPLLQEGSGRTQTIRMVLIVSSTAAVTLKIDPSVVLATRKYADDKAIEVKAYADDLMTKHLAAANPHPKYAPIASPAFTGTPKAPTPPLVANDGRIATAEFVQALAALKQPLNQTLTDLSGRDVAGILQYLGLGEAAEQGVATSAQMQAGTAANLLPTVAAVMSLFSKRTFTTADHIRIPDVPGGWIVQWGFYTPTGGTQTVNLPVAFPNMNFGTLPVMVGTSTIFGFTTTQPNGLGAFNLHTRNATGSLVATPCFCISIGN